MKLIYGDCLEKMKQLEDNSVDSCVTDPPYGLKFMGKKWDYNVPSVEVWEEVLRVLKPGAFILAFGGTRTYHRMVVNIEDTGFEIRDQIQWLYGSGFPKSLDISKAIDKAKGKEREVVGYGKRNERDTKPYGGDSESTFASNTIKALEITTPATPEAIQWDGWGTALKPANEPICLARKPLSEKTVALNVLKWGCGGINIDGCRVGMSQDDMDMLEAKSSKEFKGIKPFGNTDIKGSALKPNQQGRFPANVIHDGSDEVVGLLPNSKSPKDYKHNIHDTGVFFNTGMDALDMGNGFNDSGSAARFFYCAKASKAERGENNTHCTVKPLSLMKYLCRLITPPGGIVIDPYMGSGTTGMAAKEEGFDFIGIEKDPEYFKIAEKRIDIIKFGIKHLKKKKQGFFF